MSSSVARFERLKVVDEYLPQEDTSTADACNEGSVTRSELQRAMRRAYGIFALSVFFVACAVALSVQSNSGTFSSSAIMSFKKAKVGSVQSKWSGEDKVIVPYGFDGCDSTALPPQIAPVRRAGDFLFFSGVLGYDQPCVSAHTDPEKQIAAAFKWANITLATARTSWADVLSVTSYHVDMSVHMDTFVSEREKYVTKLPYPAWTSVGVKSLYFPNEILEMQMVARMAPCNSLECP